MSENPDSGSMASDDDATVEALARSIGEGFIESGDLDPTGMTLDELAAAIAAKIKEALNDGSKFHVVIDHQSGLLEQARAFAAAGDHDYAVMFYATWIEHWFNRMIAWRLKALKLDDSESREQLMRMSIPQKTGSGWKLLFGAPLDPDLSKGIRMIAEHRNVFVHYKWKTFDPQEKTPKALLKESGARVALAEKIAVELGALRDKLALGGYGAAELLADHDNRSLRVVREAHPSLE